MVRGFILLVRFEYRRNLILIRPMEYMWSSDIQKYCLRASG